MQACDLGYVVSSIEGHSGRWELEKQETPFCFCSIILLDIGALEPALPQRGCACLVETLGLRVQK